MTEKILYWTSVGCGFAALLLFVGNTILINGNRGIQDDVSRRQAVINNAGPMSNVNQSLAQALAEIAVKNKDVQVRDLLAAQGITVRDQDKDDAAQAKKK